MNAKAAWILSLSISLVPAAWATDAQAVERKQSAAALEEAASPATYDVFIDGVTGYAFVKTPKGWKFIRNLREDAAPKTGVVEEAAAKANVAQR